MTIHKRIEQHAREQPDAPAAIVNGHAVDYRAFWSIIRSAAQHVAGSGIAPGRIVALAFGSQYDALVGVLGCQLAGHPAVAVRHSLRGVARLQAGRVYTDRAVVAGRASGGEHLGDGWPGSGKSQPPAHVDCPIAADSLAQLLLTSGTTARQKIVPYTRRQFEYNVEQNVVRYGRSGKPRYLSLLPPTHGQGIARSFAAWQAGGTVIIESRMDPANAIVRHEPDSTHVYPALLAQILERLPADWCPRRRMRVRVGGSRLPPEAHAAARRFPGIEIEGSYGASEIFTVGLIEPVAPGAPWPDDYAVAPGLDLEVVDASDRPLPAGEPGALRMRSPGMAGAYLDAPKLSAKHFRGGWFYPGDIALLTPSGRFRIVGRESEMLDLGGVKVAPERVDAVARAVAGIRDAAAFSLSGPTGLDELWIALVRAPGAGMRDVSREIRRRLAGFSRVNIIECAEIPRNENGKVARRELAQSARMARARASR